MERCQPRSPNGAPLALDGADAEVWTWEKEITGVWKCRGEAERVVVAVNGHETPAELRGRRFRAVVRLDEGQNCLVARCRARGRECVSDSLVLEQRLKNRPTARIDVSVTDEGVLLDAAASTPSEGSGAPIIRYTWYPSKSNPAPLTDEGGRRRLHGRKAAFRVPPQNGEYRVSLHVIDAAGRRDRATTYFVVRENRPHAVDISTDHPAWVERAVVYGVVPHNFGPNGFRSVIERLDSLSDLGVDVLWLSPLNKTSRGGHGYGVDDYFAVRRDYGTKRDLRALVREAHNRGIRLAMDFVANHTSVHHPYVRDVQARGSASLYRSFYERGEKSTDHSYYFKWTQLANLNYSNPEVQRWMLEAFSYWVREFDIDGFRVDAAWGVRLRSPDFWPMWRRELKRIKPDLLLLAEASARDPYWFTHGFDAAYDWTDDLGCSSMAEVFERPQEITSRLHAALTNEGRGFHEDALIFRFLDNNDTGARFITRYGVEMERVAAAMLLTLPGLPCIYTGQESGAEFEPYRTPGPICWEDRYGLREHYKRLIALRKAVPALHSRCWDIVGVRSDGQAYGYVRHGSDGQQVLVVLNFSACDVDAEVTLASESPSLANADRFTDLLTEGEISVSRVATGSIRIPVPAQTARILVPIQTEGEEHV